MLLYKLTFPNSEICNESELYLRGGSVREDGVYLSSGESASFDTYFNCFSHIKYKKYTKVTEVTLALKIKGRARTSICLYKNNGEDVVIKELEAEDNVDISVNLENLPDEGFLYFKIEAQTDCILYSGGWHADAACKDVKIGVVICTYKREKFVKRNISNLLSHMRNLGQARFFDVFVVDNGRTLEDDFGEGVEVIPNENTGGSGGFTRGMKEVCEVYAGEYTHFLLMDDDILFDVNTLYRTYAMLCVLKEEYKDASIGGAMLVSETPYIQLEMGADWNGKKIISHRKRVDARDAKEIALNEEDGEFDYNGWFYTCMPVNTVAKYGYPLPFFIKCDDIEYGLRAAEHFIATSGIAVWHEDFDVKYTAGIEYYINRNELILNSRFPKGKGAFSQWTKLISRVGQQLVLQRYYSVDLIFKAYNDYFKGANYVFGLNGEEMHSAIRKSCPKFFTETELKEQFGISLNVDQISEKMKKKRGLGFKHIITLNGYLIPKCFYKKGIAQVNMVDYNLDGLYKKRKVLQFNPVTGKGFVTEIKKSELFKAWGKLIKYFFIMMFRYRKIAKEYAKI